LQQLTGKIATLNMFISQSMFVLQDPEKGLCLERRM